MNGNAFQYSHSWVFCVFCFCSGLTVFLPSICLQTIFLEVETKYMSPNDSSWQVVFSEMSEVTVTKNTYPSMMHDVISMSIKSEVSICWLSGSKIRFKNLEQSTVAEIEFSPAGAMTKKVNAKTEHERSNNWRSKRENCLAYSRHLCVTTRFTDVMGRRPSSSSKDAVLTSPLTHAAGYEPYDYFGRRNLALHRQVSRVQGKVASEVFKRDMKFYRKFGTMPAMLKTHTLAPTSNKTRRTNCQANSNSLYLCCSVDDDASSFCDSVSSIPCSSISHVEKQEKWTKDACELSDKTTKFDAIEKWLQGLPKPVFKTGAGHL